MTLGIDASRSVSTIQKTGVELVSDELLTEIEKWRNKEIRGKEVHPIFYTPQEIGWLPRENQRILRWPFKFLWTQVRLAWELIFHPPDKMFFPVHAMPLLLIISSILLPYKKSRHQISPTTPAPPQTQGGVATPPQGGGERTHYFRVIHDIAFKKQPPLYSLKQKLILNLDLFLVKKLCTKIFVPTNAVRQDLIHYARINPDKIVVTPWGYSSINNKQQTISNKKKQILYIGRVEEKKNIWNLIKAFNIFSEQRPDYKLILAGKIDNKFPISNFQFPNKSQIQNQKSHNTSYIIHNTIEFLGYVSEEKKHELLSESVALVLVSKEEGFGFPILEAFDFGLPVVASDIPVLREIGGEACLYADPDSPEDIASQLEKVITDENLSRELTTAGHERLVQFSWPKTAKQILSEILGE